MTQVERFKAWQVLDEKGTRQEVGEITGFKTKPETQRHGENKQNLTVVLGKQAKPPVHLNRKIPLHSFSLQVLLFY